MDGIHQTQWASIKLNGHEFEQTLGDSEVQGSWHAAVHGVTNSLTQFSDQTTIKVL